MKVMLVEKTYLRQYYALAVTLIINSLFMSACDTTDYNNPAKDPIYLWKRITFFDDISETPFLYVSNDNSYAYVYAYDKKKLYVSSDKGESWELFSKDNILKQKGEANTIEQEISYDISNGLEGVLPTQQGVLLYTSTSLFLIKGKKVVWAYHQPVSHIQIAQFNGVETIIFVNKQQPEMINLKRTDQKPYGNDTYQKSIISLNYEGAIKAIGKSYNGNLLFILQKGSFYDVMEVLPENLPNNDGSYDNSLGKPIFDNNNMPATWFNIPQRKHILKALFSLHNQNENKSEYFIAIDNTDYTIMSHANGYTETNNKYLSNEKWLDLDAEGIYDIKEIFGRMIIFTDKGELVLNGDGTFTSEHELKLSHYAKSKQNMMKGSKAQLLFDEKDDVIYTTYGDDNLSWFMTMYIKKEIKLYIREKSTGNPRS